MKVWTYQRKDNVDKILTSGIFSPDFNQGQIYGVSRDAYNYILNEYNKQSQTSNKGLIFSFNGNYKHLTLETKEELEIMLKEVGNPSGTSFSKDTHCLLELNIPDDVYKMMIDFYLFTDLMFFMDDQDEDEIKLSKENLFRTNRRDGYELSVCHFPYIKNSWIKNIYEI